MDGWDVLGCWMLGMWIRKDGMGSGKIEGRGVDARFSGGRTGSQSEIREMGVPLRDRE